MPKVVWLRPIRGRYGKTVQRIEATLVAIEEDWCTAELENGERHSARTEDVMLVRMLAHRRKHGRKVNR